MSRSPAPESWVAPTPAPVDGPTSGAERPMLAGLLAWHRSNLLRACAGLTAQQLVTASVPPSNLTLLGLVRHAAKVERTWFRQRVAGTPVGPLYDPALGRDADFEDLDPGQAPTALARFVEECRLADAAVAQLDLDTTFEHDGETMSLRMVYLHLIGEHAQHVGHADLIRERVLVATG